MILVVGSSKDTVFPALNQCLRESGHPFVAIDEDDAGKHSVKREASNGQSVYRIVGDGCTGKTPVNAIFVRHAVARTLDARQLQEMGHLQGTLNSMMRVASCPILNPPANAFSNYSKAYQGALLAEAGFDIPRSLVTNVPEEARKFWEECKGEVIFKGVSNMTTLAQLLTADKLPRLDLLPCSPTLFQEYVAGDDYRVHVVGNEAFVTRVVAENVDYRRTGRDEPMLVEAAELDFDTVHRCIAFTHSLGLIASGMDFKRQASGRLVALELNPYPLFTFYDRRSGQPITRAIVDYLIQNQTEETNIFA